MVNLVVFDAGPLGMAVSPRPRSEFVTWYEQLTVTGVAFVVPEIADYEVRRELVRAGLPEGTRRLDTFIASVAYEPITPRSCAAPPNSGPRHEAAAGRWQIGTPSMRT